MITESDAYRKDERFALVYSLLGSIALNALVWILSLWIAGLHLHILIPQPHMQELEASSSSITLDRRVVPKIARNFTPPIPPQAAAPTQVAAESRPAEHPVENSTLSQQLAQQEQTFAKEAQQLKASRPPLSDASAAPFKPSTFQRNYLDLEGAEHRERVEALLLPFQRWTEGDRTCYYVTYTAQFSGGGTENGTIPWKLCYPTAHDAMLPLNRPHLLPIPYPPPDFPPLPPGTTLGPLLKSIYDARPR